MGTVERVMKAAAAVDPDLADFLWRATVDEAYWSARNDLIAKRGRKMLVRADEMVDRIAKSAVEGYARLARAGRLEEARALAAVSKARWEEAAATRDALVYEIAKAGGDSSFQDQWGNLRRVRRDDKGRFTRKLSANESDVLDAQQAGNFFVSRESKRAPADLRSAQQSGSAPLPEAAFGGVFVDNNQLEVKGAGRGQGGTDLPEAAQTKRMLATASQVNQIQRELREAFGADGAKMLRLEMPVTTQLGTTKTVDLPVDPSQPLTAEQLPVGGTAYEVSYGLKPEFANPDEIEDQGVQRRAKAIQRQLELSQIPGIDTNRLTPQLLDQLARATEVSPAAADRPRTERLADLMELGGRGATWLGAPALGNTLAGGAAAVREAEQFKKPMQRALYRMRGIHRKPDEELASAVDGRAMGDDERRIVQGVISGELDAGKVMELAGAARASGSASPMMLEMARRVREGQSAQQAVLGAQRDVAAGRLIQRMLEATGEVRDGGSMQVNFERISDSVAQKLGRGFPSEGVIISADGKVTTQAVGVAEDHYLPFDVGSRAKALSGGSYVRTRSLGGVTSEDLRGMLLGNARAATVVSRSGVFDIELATDLRGKRRIRAMGMPETFDRILDEIAEGEHYARDLDPEERGKVENLVANAVVRNPDMTTEEQEKLFNREMTKARTRLSQVTDRERMQLQKEAAEEAAERLANKHIQSNEVERTERQIFSEKLKVLKKDKVRRLNVNAEGYEVALKTLQRYYPYFVRSVSRRSLSEVADTQEPEGVRSNDRPGAKLMRDERKRPEAMIENEGRADPWRVGLGNVTARPRQGLVANRGPRRARLEASVAEKPAAPEASAASAAAGGGSSSPAPDGGQPKAPDSGGGGSQAGPPQGVTLGNTHPVGAVEVARSQADSLGEEASAKLATFVSKKKNDTFQVAGANAEATMWADRMSDLDGQDSAPKSWRERPESQGKTFKLVRAIQRDIEVEGAQPVLEAVGGNPKMLEALTDSGTARSYAAVLENGQGDHPPVEEVQEALNQLASYALIVANPVDGGGKFRGLPMADASESNVADPTDPLEWVKAASDAAGGKDPGQPGFLFRKVTNGLSIAEAGPKLAKVAERLKKYNDDMAGVASDGEASAAYQALMAGFKGDVEAGLKEVVGDDAREAAKRITGQVGNTYQEYDFDSLPEQAGAWFTNMFNAVAVDAGSNGGGAGPKALGKLLGLTREVWVNKQQPPEPEAPGDPKVWWEVFAKQAARLGLDPRV